MGTSPSKSIRKHKRKISRSRFQDRKSTKKSARHAKNLLLICSSPEPFMKIKEACERDCKPSSVEDDHLSRPGVAAQAQAISGTQRATDSPYPSCTGWGLHHGRVARPWVSSYLAFPSLPDQSGGISLLHSPWSRLHRPLAGTLPCSARTFLIPFRARDRLVTSHAKEIYLSAGNLSSMNQKMPVYKPFPVTWN